MLNLVKNVIVSRHKDKSASLNNLNGKIFYANKAISLKTISFSSMEASSSICGSISRSTKLNLGEPKKN